MASDQHLWTAGTSCPTPWLLLSWVSPHWFPHSWYTGEGSSNCPGRKRPPRGCGGEARTLDWEFNQRPLGVNLRGTSGNSTHPYPHQKELLSHQPALNVHHCTRNVREKNAPVPAKNHRSTLETDGRWLGLQVTPPGPEVRNARESLLHSNKLWPEGCNWTSQGLTSLPQRIREQGSVVSEVLHSLGLP